MMALSQLESVVLRDVLSQTPLEIYNSAINSGNIQFIYERKKNDILYKYFNGNIRSWSIFMATLFSKFITPADEIRLNEIQNQLNSLRQTVKHDKRFKRPSLQGNIDKYNQLVDEANQLAKGLKVLARYFKQYKKY